MAQKKSTTEQIKNARRWQRHLQMWRESGQTQVEYCRLNNLGVKAFGYWLRKDRKINNPAPLQLIPVTFNRQPEVNPVEKSSTGLYFNFSDRARIEISRDFDRETFSQIISVLSSI
ncbi:MAG TPA: hypothetical protein DCG57_17030 [Candidatus Riflebacteria bacterium]|jgi:hypothetical protein|nr:hypothetical protein [Candidatus Riflebacteria bacterium]